MLFRSNTEYYDTQVRLTQGRMENLVAPLGKVPGRFEISTPAAVTAVRGTHYRVNAATDATRSEVLEGMVGVSNDDDGVEVAAGYGTLAAANQAPAAPIVLLPAPDLAKLPARLEWVPVAVTVDALSGAQAYRFQLAANADFNPPVFDARADNTRLRGPDLPDGHYFLRVRGIDAQGSGRARSLSDLGNRDEASGRARTDWRAFEANSGLFNEDARRYGPLSHRRSRLCLSPPDS